MDPEKKRRLDEAISDLQDRFGMQAVIRQHSDKRATSHFVPTSFPSLDQALAIGGLPRGRISEIIGVPTSGRATIALKIMASAQGKGQTAVYIDTNHTFDPAYAAQFGLDLNGLILVRPAGFIQALAVLRDFILSGGISILVFELALLANSQPKEIQSLGNTLERIIAPLGHTNCVLLFLTSLLTNQPSSLIHENPALKGNGPYMKNYPTDGALPHFSTIRLFIQRESWIYKERDIRGYQARVQVLKNKLGPAGQQVSLNLDFHDEL